VVGRKLSAAIWGIIAMDYDGWATSDCIEALGTLGEYRTLIDILERTQHQDAVGSSPVHWFHKLCVDALSGCKDEGLLQRVSWAL
jgi:hypothetical protein